MALNNHGWGLREMIIFVSILLLFLIIASIFVLRLYNSLNESINGDTNTNEVVDNVDKNYYYHKESELLQSAQAYYDDVPFDLDNGSVNVYLNELISGGYSKQIVDENTGNYCNGYAKYFKNQNTVDIDVFIKCDSYETEGYIG